MKKLVVLWGFFAAGALQAQTASMTKKAPEPLLGDIYAEFDLRHNISTFYDKDGNLLRQPPSLQAKAKVGKKFFDQSLDTSLAFGVLKRPQTQQVEQLRPEFELNYFPYAGDFGSFLLYGIVQFPVKRSTAAETTDSRDDLFFEESSDSTATVIGLSPLLRYPVRFGGSALVMRASGDAWTRAYSQKQYMNGEKRTTEKQAFGLADDVQGDEKEFESREDTAQRYGTQLSAGINFVPEFIPSTTFDLGTYYDTRYIPRYVVNTDDSLDYDYAAIRTSHYRLRARYAINSKLTLSNDFYHFHDGLFARKRVDDERRFRNVARLTLTL